MFSCVFSPTVFMDQGQFDGPSLFEQVHLELVIDVRKVDEDEGVRAGGPLHPLPHALQHNHYLVIPHRALQVLGQLVGIDEGRARAHIEDGEDKEDKPQHGVQAWVAVVREHCPAFPRSPELLGLNYRGIYTLTCPFPPTLQYPLNHGRL